MSMNHRRAYVKEFSDKTRDLKPRAYVEVRLMLVVESRHEAEVLCKALVEHMEKPSPRYLTLSGE